MTSVEYPQTPRPLPLVHRRWSDEPLAEWSIELFESLDALRREAAGVEDMRGMVTLRVIDLLSAFVGSSPPDDVDRGVELLRLALVEEPQRTELGTDLDELARVSLGLARVCREQRQLEQLAEIPRLWSTVHIDDMTLVACAFVREMVRVAIDTVEGPELHSSLAELAACLDARIDTLKVLESDRMSLEQIAAASKTELETDLRHRRARVQRQADGWRLDLDAWEAGEAQLIGLSQVATAPHAGQLDTGGQADLVQIDKLRALAEVRRLASQDDARALTDKLGELISRWASINVDEETLPLSFELLRRPCPAQIRTKLIGIWSTRIGATPVPLKTRARLVVFLHRCALDLLLDGADADGRRVDERTLAEAEAIADGIARLTEQITSQRRLWSDTLPPSRNKLYTYIGGRSAYEGAIRHRRQLVGRVPDPSPGLRRLCATLREAHVSEESPSVESRVFHHELLELIEEVRSVPDCQAFIARRVVEFVSPSFPVHANVGAKPDTIGLALAVELLALARRHTPATLRSQTPGLAQLALGLHTCCVRSGTLTQARAVVDCWSEFDPSQESLLACGLVAELLYAHGLFECEHGNQASERADALRTLCDRLDELELAISTKRDLDTDLLTPAEIIARTPDPREAAIRVRRADLRPDARGEDLRARVSAALDGAMWTTRRRAQLRPEYWRSVGEPSTQGDVARPDDAELIEAWRQRIELTKRHLEFAEVIGAAFFERLNKEIMLGAAKLRVDFIEILKLGLELRDYDCDAGLMILSYKHVVYMPGDELSDRIIAIWDARARTGPVGPSVAAGLAQLIAERAYRLLNDVGDSTPFTERIDQLVALAHSQRLLWSDFMKFETIASLVRHPFSEFRRRQLRSYSEYESGDNERLIGALLARTIADAEREEEEDDDDDDDDYSWVDDDDDS